MKNDVKLKSYYLLAFGFWVLLCTTFGCGAIGNSSDEAPTGLLTISNNSGQTIYNMNTKPSGTNDWENITPNINGNGSQLSTGYNVTVEVPIGEKDFLYEYMDGAGNMHSNMTNSAFTISQDKRTNANINQNGPSFTYSSNPSGGGGTGGAGTGGSGSGSSCESSSGYRYWYQQCANNQLSQAPCYCAAAVLEQCYGETAAAQANYGLAAQLGTRCW